MAKLKQNINYLLAGIISVFGTQFVTADDETNSETKKPQKESGNLSAGAIAAAVAAAAAIGMHTYSGWLQ